jgi:hypothetical protein
VRESFKARFCRRFHCALTEYETRALKKLFYRHAKPFAFLLSWARPEYFTKDLTSPSSSCFGRLKTTRKRRRQSPILGLKFCRKRFPSDRLKIRVPGLATRMPVAYFRVLCHALQQTFANKGFFDITVQSSLLLHGSRVLRALRRKYRIAEERLFDVSNGIVSCILGELATTYGRNSYQPPRRGQMRTRLSSAGSACAGRK